MPGPYDFAIIGSTTLSLVLAGVLARDHGRKVVRVGRRHSAERLPRGPDLAFMLATRPQTWRMLRDADAETRALLAAIGVRVHDVNVDIVADAEATGAALDHIGHIAAAYRQTARPMPGGWRFGGVTLVPSAGTRLLAWLEGLGVDFVADDTPAIVLTDGRARLGGVEAQDIVVADDAAVLDLSESLRPRGLSATPMTMTLIDRAPASGQSLRFHPDRGVTVLPRDGKTSLVRVRHDGDTAMRLASVLEGPFPIQRLATAQYRVASSIDGAPVIGRRIATGPFVIAGLGDATAFFAPAVARLLTGNPSAEEAAWLSMHRPADARPGIAEFAP
jgi:hypothetical protein